MEKPHTFNPPTSRFEVWFLTEKNAFIPTKLGFQGSDFNEKYARQTGGEGRGVYYGQTVRFYWMTNYRLSNYTLVAQTDLTNI
jgi:hypothetical protein